MNEPTAQRRTIRSFALRAGRTTAAQQRALIELWPQFGITVEPGTTFDLQAIFRRAAARVLEIGFGNGETLAHYAQQHPEIDFLGCEVHPPGVGHLLQLIATNELRNVRVIRHDAVEVLRDSIREQSLDRILILFPDPWPKARHHKRRLIQAPFVDLLVSRLRQGGTLALATDWEPYAQQMLEVLAAHPALRNLAPDGRFVERPPWRIETRFERRGLRLGHRVRDLAFLRSG